MSQQKPGFYHKTLSFSLVSRDPQNWQYFPLVHNWSKKCPRRSPSQKSGKTPEKTGKRKWFSDVEKISSTCRICSRSSKTSFGCPFAPNFFAQHCSFSGGRSCLAGCSQLPQPTSYGTCTRSQVGNLSMLAAEERHKQNQLLLGTRTICCSFPWLRSTLL